VKVYGVHACLALHRARPEAVRRAFVARELVHQLGELLRDLAQRRVPYGVVEDDELERVSGSQHHEGICIYAAPRPVPDEPALLAGVGRGPARLVYLDGVENPHNVGAILRTAAHFGCVAVAGAKASMPAPNGATARIAEGGAERVALLRWEDPIASLRAWSSRFALIATAHDARQSLFDAELPERCAFLMGAEGPGLSPEVRALAHRTVAIPGTGAVESLNVAAATAVLLAEHRRRHPR
jgi:TrmH RNA methyltransferase